MAEILKVQGKKAETLGMKYAGYQVMTEKKEDNIYEVEKMTEKMVVIVDDDESIRKTFYLLLHKKYNVNLAKDASEAIRKYLNSRIDLIITDLRLPDGDGLEMITEFRKSGYKGQVILISAYPDMVKLEDLEHLQIGYFFVKPLDLDALNRSIEYLLVSPEYKTKTV